MNPLHMFFKQNVIDIASGVILGLYGFMVINTLIVFSTAFVIQAEMAERQMFGFAMVAVMALFLFIRSVLQNNR